jgi:hypothetical protein
LARNKKFEEFTRPVDVEEVPDYLEVIERPCDFEAMMTKLNSSNYFSAKEFLDDIHLIYSNCLAYNPHKTESDKRLRMRAFELKDFAEKLIEDEMDSDFERECRKIIKARNKRNENVEETTTTGENARVPKPKSRQTATTSQNSQASCSSSNGAANSTTAIAATVLSGFGSPVLSGSAVRPSGSRPTSANRSKKRKSAWSKGSIPKPKKCNRSIVVTNLEKKSFSQLQDSQSQEQQGGITTKLVSCSDDDEIDVDVVGDEEDENEMEDVKILVSNSNSVEEEENSSHQKSSKQQLTTTTRTKFRLVPCLSQSPSSSEEVTLVGETSGVTMNGNQNQDDLYQCKKLT